MFAAPLHAALSAAPAPSNYDLSTACPPVRDQEWIGACVAFATCSAKSFLFSRGLAAGHVVLVPAFSPLDLYYATRAYEGTPSGEDSGCQVRDAMRVLRDRGTCTEIAWPFAPARFSDAPPQSAVDDAARHKSVFYYRLGGARGANLDLIKASIAQGYPAVGGFSVPSSMLSDDVAQSGIVTFPPSSEGFDGGHAVLFVGYDDRAKLLKFQNSWGTDWGVGGFGFLDYRFVTDGLADDFWTLRREAV